MLSTLHQSIGVLSRGYFSLYLGAALRGGVGSSPRATFPAAEVSSFECDLGLNTFSHLIGRICFQCTVLIPGDRLNWHWKGIKLIKLDKAMLTGDKCCFNLSLWDQIQVSFFPHLHWLLLVRNNLTIGSLLTQHLNNTGVKEVREK
eukprot:scaffold26707_cov200-Skeletonema_menzelii.AAC.1